MAAFKETAKSKRRLPPIKTRKLISGAHKSSVMAFVITQRYSSRPSRKKNKINRHRAIKRQKNRLFCINSNRNLA